MNKLRSDITLELENVRTETNITTTNIMDAVEQNRAECLAAVDRSMRCNDLIVSGVPYITGENLPNYFVNWCKSLGYVDEFIPIVDIKRLTKNTPTNGTIYLILIQFAITVQRNEFYTRYLRTRKLSLTDIGFSTDRRVFVNENLVPAARELRTKALHMKKKGELAGVFTRMGVVYVKRRRPGEAYIVRK